MSNPANARNVLEQVSSGRTPERDSGEPGWDQAKVQLVRDWITPASRLDPSVAMIMLGGPT